MIATTDTVTDDRGRLLVNGSPLDVDAPIMRRSDGIALLTRNGVDNGLGVPCSRYGRDTADCAPVAWRLAYIVARDTGEPVTYRGLDWAMSLVVNDHDDVAYIIRNYGHRQYS